MIAGATSCFPNGPQGLHMHTLSLEDVCSSLEANSSGSDNHTNSLLYNLSILKEKVHQAQSLVTIFLVPDQGQQPTESTTIAVASMGSLIQEIMVTASSMMFTCQQMALGASTTSGNSSTVHQSHHPHVKPSDVALCQPNRSSNRVVNAGEERSQVLHSGETIEWYGYSYITGNTNDNSHSNIAISGENEAANKKRLARGGANNDANIKARSPTNYDITELDAADLLAKYTHYCHVCGKGFKRDANLRMHMRAHGDEYKTSEALSNPAKNGNASGEASVARLPRKYSCPQEGCRWNKKHPKFQPLKSMICVKNHYKRSHCPKMYVCKRCNRKQFSVLSDLRTHEKHCGDLKWQCSCGTTFSRKDKLMGHVALFVGHSPAISSLTKMGKVDQNLQKMH